MIGKTPITQAHVGQMCHEGVACIGDMDIVSSIVGSVGRPAAPPGKKLMSFVKGISAKTFAAMRNEARNVAPKIARTVVEICEIS